MKSSSANRPILFIEKKKELENSKHHLFHHIDDIKIDNKNDKIIYISRYKRKKIKNICIKKTKQLSFSKMKNKVFIIVLISLFLLFIATGMMKQNSNYQNTNSHSYSSTIQNDSSLNKNLLSTNSLETFILVNEDNYGI